MIGVDDGVVVGVDDFLPGAVLQLVGAAGGLEHLELRRIALRVRGAVAADRVEDDDGVLLHRLEPSSEIGQHDLVVAIRVRTMHGIGVAWICNVHHPSADAFAASIVVAPLDGEVRLRQRVEQIRVTVGLVDVEMLARQVGEHAWHGDRRRRAARRCVIEVHQVRTRHQLRIRRARIAAELEIRGPRRLADHQEQDQRLGAGSCGSLHVPGGIDQRRVRIATLLRGQQPDEAHDWRGRAQCIADGLVLAKEDRVVRRAGEQRDCAQCQRGTDERQPLS